MNKSKHYRKLHLIAVGCFIMFTVLAFCAGVIGPRAMYYMACLAGISLVMAVSTRVSAWYHQD